VSLFPEQARCYSINSTQLNPAQVWLSVYWCNVVQRDGETVSGKELKLRGQKSTLDIHLFKALTVYDVPRLVSLQQRQTSHTTTTTAITWWRGVVVSGVCCMNEVNIRRARLVLGWVTVFGRV